MLNLEKNRAIKQDLEGYTCEYFLRSTSSIPVSPAFKYEIVTVVDYVDKYISKNFVWNKIFVVFGFVI